MIRISVVIPVYNMGKSIFDTVQTLLNQTYKHYEIILVDDGSKDESGRICDELAANYSKIRVIHTENRGSGPARNTGIENATGDYIYFPDADDIIDTKTFEILNNHLLEHEFDLIVFGYKNVRNGVVVNEKVFEVNDYLGENIRKDYIHFASMDSKCAIQGAPWNKLFKLSVIKDNKIEFPPLRRHQDDAFIGRYVSYIKDVRFIGDVLYTYYLNDLGKEWDKYPKNYLDCVIGLYDCRKSNILKWNSDDAKTHNLIYLSYISGVIKALELYYSPKHEFDYRSRLTQIKYAIDKTGINTMDISKEYQMRYQRIVLFLIKHRMYKLLYCVLGCKVIVESRFNLLFNLIKKTSRGI